MKQVCASFAIAMVVFLGGLLPMAPASAVPPTVTPSPGYDARLQEQRAARTYAPPVDESVVRDQRPSRHHVRRVHHGAHD
jgi:hypothetical protein